MNNEAVWILDDDSSIRWVLQKALKTADIESCCFENGSENGSGKESCCFVRRVRPPNSSSRKKI